MNILLDFSPHTEIHLGWKMHLPSGRTLSQTMGNPITIKPEAVSYTAEQFSWAPLPCCSLSGYSFPVKSLALSAHMSHWTIWFRVLGKKPLSGPARDPLSWHSGRCKATVHCRWCHHQALVGEEALFLHPLRFCDLDPWVKLIRQMNRRNSLHELIRASR